MNVLEFTSLVCIGSFLAGLVLASDPSFTPLPEDPATLQVLLLAALAERDRARQHAEAQEALAREKSAWAAEQGKRADDLYVQTLRLQLELERYKKWYYGPRADRLKSSIKLGASAAELRRGAGAETCSTGGCGGGN